MDQKKETDIPIADVEKVHAESLQLRNQQFIIGTIALTGSGLSLWFFTKLYEDNSGNPGLTLFVVLFSWYFIFVFLFYWSLTLRKIITIISEYLKRSTVAGEPATHWEHWYFEHSRKNGKIKIKSQTKHVKWALIFYGFIACVISLDICLQPGDIFSRELDFLELIRSLLNLIRLQLLQLGVIIAFFTIYSIIIMHIDKRFEEDCRLAVCFTHLIFTYFVYQSGCVFRSERAPIGIGNGMIRSS